MKYDLPGDLIVEADGPVRTVIMNRPENQTGPVWLQAFNEGARGTDWGGVMAGSTLMALPVVVFFLIVQGKVTAGLTAGAVKG